MAVRDLAAAPMLEEFAFRACMAPLLLLGVRAPPIAVSENAICDCARQIGLHSEAGSSAEIAVRRQININTPVSSRASAGDGAGCAEGVRIGCQGPSEADASSRRPRSLCGL